jgi:enoyl-CoA hydratase/carnithine racemase
MSLQFIEVETTDGVTVATINRPPVNAFSEGLYRDFIALSDMIVADNETRCLVVAAKPDCRAWGGGAELKEFLVLGHDTRLERYKLVTEAMRRFGAIDRPVIGALNGHVIGVGMTFANLCDMRISYPEAWFAKPELDRGVVTTVGPFQRVGFPNAKSREMIYTARRFTAAELEPTGFFNYLVPRDQVVPRSLELAREIAGRSLPALKAAKICNNAAESMTWDDAYVMSQTYSADLTAGSDSKEGIRAFLEQRKPEYQDR